MRYVLRWGCCCSHIFPCPSYITSDVGLRVSQSRSVAPIAVGSWVVIVVGMDIVIGCGGQGQRAAVDAPG